MPAAADKLGTSSGWYSVVKAQLCRALPDRSGTAIALANLSRMFSAVAPDTVGLVAQRAGLQTAMWLLMAGPLAFALGLRDVPRNAIGDGC